MPDRQDLSSHERAQLESIKHLLWKALRAHAKVPGRPLRSEDQARIEAGMRQVCTIVDTYREALFEQVHSARVKGITSDLEGLANLLKGFGDQGLSPRDVERVRARIKSWRRESRQWVFQLPLQDAAACLPALAGLDGEARRERLKACWSEAGGSLFAPPPPTPHALPEGVPAHFQPAHPEGPPGLHADHLDASPSGAPNWTPKPGPLLELLAYAEELLLLEAGGADRGGHTTFADRRRRASFRDAFALSCVLVFERVAGPKAARQSQIWRRTIRPTLFESFVQKVQEAAVGGPIPRIWALGPDPIRKAIKLQRAWQKLFQAAGVPDSAGFSGLPEEARQAALQMLEDSVRVRLKAHVRPWV